MSTPDGTPDTTTAALQAARAHRQGVRSACEGLERALASAATGRSANWSAVVVDRLGALQDAFALHVATTEAPEGLLTEVMANAPRLAHRVDRLRADHVTIGQQLDHASGQARSGAPAEDIRDEALALLSRISQHRHIGADLVYEAYWVDIEAAD